MPECANQKRRVGSVDSILRTTPIEIWCIMLVWVHYACVGYGHYIQVNLEQRTLMKTPMPAMVGAIHSFQRE